MNVLSIDTAGPVIGVGLRFQGGSAARVERIQRGADGRILPWSMALLCEHGLGPADLDGIAIAIGPGSFTGLRVGMAAAMGLAQALGCPLWGGSSLAHRARAVGVGTTLVLMDARKGRVYAALFSDTGQILSGPADIAPEQALGWCSGLTVTATGEGATVYSELCQEHGVPIAADPADPGVLQLALLGQQGLSAGQGVGPLSLKPVYLRAPDAKKPKKH